MSDDIVASAYLIVKATRKIWGSPDPETGLKEVESAKIIMARQSRPPKLDPDEVLIKVSVQLPKTVFGPITPSALIVVPNELVLDRHQIEVEATEGAEEP